MLRIIINNKYIPNALMISFQRSTFLNLFDLGYWHEEILTGLAFPWYHRMRKTIGDKLEIVDINAYSNYYLYSMRVVQAICLTRLLRLSPCLFASIGALFVGDKLFVPFGYVSQGTLQLRCLVVSIQVVPMGTGILHRENVFTEYRAVV